MKRSKVPQQTNTATKFMFLQDTAHKGIKPVFWWWHAFGYKIYHIVFNMEEQTNS
jgi:hypothetical protein